MGPWSKTKQAVLLALKIGVVNRYLVNRRLLKHLDQENEDHMRSLDYTMGILLFLEASEVWIDTEVYPIL